MPLPKFMTYAEASAARSLAGQLAAETALFKAWLVEKGRAYDGFATNVRLGKGEDPGPSYPDYARRFAVLTTQKRADLVAERAGRVTIFEIKVQANLSEVGQLIGYRFLWQQEFPTIPVDELRLIAHHLTADTIAVLLHAGIAYDLFPDVVLPDLVDVSPPGAPTAAG